MSEVLLGNDGERIGDGGWGSLDGVKWERENWKERNEPGREVTRRARGKTNAKRESVKEREV